MAWNVAIILLIAFLAWGYLVFCPPSSFTCGSTNGPPIEGLRIKLRDGRHLAYKEHGVPKERSKYKIIYIHGFTSSKHEASFATSELIEKLEIHFVTFDRPGYGESDPDPKRTIKSTALDIEELGEKLGLGTKFYIIGMSMGGQIVWGCLKHIPHRLAGAAMIAPAVNYWWPHFPSYLQKEAYYQQFPQDQWALQVAHRAPWLVYWWNTQKWFPRYSIIEGTQNLTAPDLEVISKLANERGFNQDYATQQGVHESLHRDMLVAFGHWDFDPMDLEDPFPTGQGSVHLWHGVEDGVVPIVLQSYIAQKLAWVRYHEVPDAGHLFALPDGKAKDEILSTLLVGK